MTGILHDLRYAFRQLGKSPGFTAVAIITLAFGIGANTAIFSLINAIMLRTLPVKDPQSLVLLKWKAHRIPETTASFAYDNCTHGEGSWNGHALISQAPLETEGCSFSFPLFQAMQAKSNIFSSVLAFVPEPGNLTVNLGGRISQARALFVSGNFFSVLGARPALGRLIAPTDDSAAATPAVVVSYGFWQNELGQDRSLVGKHVLVGKTLFTVAGVTGPEFPELDPGLPSDIWAPLASQPVVEARFPKMTAPDALWIELMARLRPGVSSAQAAAAASAALAAATTNGPEAMFKPDDAPQVELSTAARGLSTLRQNFSQPLLALFAGVGIILLIACANLAGLMLARSAARQKELAMRVALGATRVRILRQLLTESLLLSLIGGAAGILLGYLGAGAQARFLSHNWYLPVQVDVHPDAHVLIFTLLVSILAGVAFGLAPMFSSRRLELVPALKETSSIVAGGRRIAPGNSLVVVQIALAMLVLAGMGLLVRTLANLKTEKVGFDPENVVVFRVDATYSNRTGESLPALYRDLQERLSSLPGVSSASRSGVLLLSGGGMGGPIFSLDQPGIETGANQLPVADNFFQTMRIPLLEGRALNMQESAGPRSNDAPTPVVVNEALVRRLFGSQDALGRRFGVNRDTGAEDEVVGVAADAKYDNLRDDIRPTIYTSVASWDGDIYFEVRTALDPEAMMPQIRAAVRRFDSNLLIADMKTQEEQMDQNIYQERLVANLSSLFALLALIVACIGIYGLLSYQVTRRTQEMGIRLALGAQRGDVLRIVLWQGVLLAVIGTLVGTAGALVLTRYLQSFLYGVKPSDPLTMVAVAVLLIAVALLASYIPARRAASIEPMEALRTE